MVRDGDFLVVSEKAVSTALGNIVDEGLYKPRSMAWFLAGVWMRLVWGWFLGYLCHMRVSTIKRLRAYPNVEGAFHKETVLRYAGFLQALRHASEGGIDVVNLPQSYAALPLKNPETVAEGLHERVLKATGKRVTVAVSDSDRTFTFRNFHFTPKPNPVRGIHPMGGVIAYILGAFLRLKARATPIAVVGHVQSLDELLKVCELADKARGYGAGRDVWEMAERFGVSYTEVTWEMLKAIPHHPLVLIRRKRLEV